MTIEVRLAGSADLPAMAGLQEHSFGVATPAMEEALARNLASEQTRLWVAALGPSSWQRVVGFGRLSQIELPGPPPGAYLAGLIVHPDFRGMGIASKLIRARIDFAWSSGQDAVYYFANARNELSISLHAKFGFSEIERPFTFPGVTFEGGVGVLFRLDAAR